MATASEEFQTLHDLAADGSWLDSFEAFTVGHGRTEWESANYPEHGSGRTVRVERLVPGETTDQPCVIGVRYLNPDAAVTLIPRGAR